MPDEAIKKRLERAKRKAEIDLRNFGYDVIKSDNRPVCLVAKQGEDTRAIRICIDKITKEDLTALNPYSEFRREIWLRRSGVEKFEIRKL
jgi:hypothetical protein